MFVSIFEDRLLFYRERGAGVYGSFPYWLSSCAPYIPQCLAATLSYSSIVYYMTGLNPGIGEPPAYAYAYPSPPPLCLI